MDIAQCSICPKPAEWEVEYGPAPNDATLACDDCIANAIGDVNLATLRRLTPEQKQRWGSQQETT